MTARHARGRRTNRVVAAWLAVRGWPDATPTFGSEPGQDVKNLDGWSVEVKARADFDPRRWLRQAQANAADGQRAVCVVRMNGQGEDAGEYLAFSRLEDHELNRSRFA